MVVAGELEQTGVKLDGSAAAVEHGAAQVVVDECAGHAAQGLESLDVSAEEALEGLVEGEEGGDGAGVAEDHDESGDRAGAVSDADLAEGAPVHLTLLADQSDDAAVDGACGLGPQAPHEASDLDDRARVAALADHLVDACGAQPAGRGRGRWAEPWHNSRDRLGLSELGAVTRVRWPIPGPHPTSESAPYATRTQCRPPAPGPWTPALPWTQRARPPELGKPRGRGFPQRPQPSSSPSSRSTREDRCPSRAHRRVSRIRHFLAIVDRVRPPATEHYFF